MNSEGDHTFAVVEKDESGVVTAIKADVCVTCHDGEHALFVGEGLVDTEQEIWNGSEAVATTVTQTMVDESAAVLEEEAEGYQQAGELLLDMLKLNNGMTNYTGALLDYTTATTANDFGAFQNSFLPSDEPGGYAHNRYYVKRALFDAIDWAEDGSIDGTIDDYSASYAAATEWLGTSRP